MILVSDHHIHFSIALTLGHLVDSYAIYLLIGTTDTFPVRVIVE